MTDPVLMPDGHTYNRSAITASSVSPFTGQALNISQAKPDGSIKKLIDSYTSGVISQSVVPITKINLVQFTASVSEKETTEFVHICVKPEDNGGRAPLSLIAMIDVSGSMYNNACENVEGLKKCELVASPACSTLASYYC